MKPFLCAAALALFPALGQAATLSTLDDESATLFSWGNGSTPTYGQTFTLGSAASLDAITFRLQDYGVANFTLSVFAWDVVSGNRPVATALASGTGASSGTGVMESQRVVLSGNQLAAGKYVFLVEPGPGTGGGMSFGSIGLDDDYTGGEIVYSNDFLSVAPEDRDYFVGAWYDSQDLAFAVEYTPVAAVPLGGAAPFALTAMAGFALLRRRKAT